MNKKIKSKNIQPPSNHIDKEGFRNAHLDFLAYALSPKGREEMKLTEEQIRELEAEAERCSKEEER